MLRMARTWSSEPCYSLESWPSPRRGPTLTQAGRVALLGPVWPPLGRSGARVTAGAPGGALGGDRWATARWGASDRERAVIRECLLARTQAPACHRAILARRPSAAATSANTPDQSPARSCRKRRALGY